MQEVPLAVRRSFVIQNQLGMHARAATALLLRVMEFEAELWVEKDGQRVNAKTSGAKSKLGEGMSVLGLITLVAPCGSTIDAEAIGPDAEQLLEALGQLIADKFGESE
jgi:phosphocarrier protein HPr